MNPQLFTLAHTKLAALGGALLLAVAAAPGCSKHHCQEGSSSSEPVKDAPTEAEFAPYIPEGAAACGPTEEGKWKVQRFSFDMELDALTSTLADKNKGLEVIKCPPEQSHFTACWADGNKRLSAKAYRSAGSVLTLHYREFSGAELGAQCKKATLMLDMGGDFAADFSAFIATCSGGCNAADATSCEALDKGMKALCRVDKGVCAKLCSSVKSKSAKDLACKLSS